MREGIPASHLQEGDYVKAGIPTVFILLALTIGCISTEGASQDPREVWDSVKLSLDSVNAYSYNATGEVHRPDGRIEYGKAYGHVDFSNRTATHVVQTNSSEAPSLIRTTYIGEEEYITILTPGGENKSIKYDKVGEWWVNKRERILGIKENDSIEFKGISQVRIYGREAWMLNLTITRVIEEQNLTVITNRTEWILKDSHLPVKRKEEAQYHGSIISGTAVKSTTIFYDYR